MKYYKIWLPVLSLVLFIGLAELICRVFSLTDKLDADFKFYINNVDDDLKQSYMAQDAYLMWFPRPNFHNKDIQINSRGFRDREYKIKKDKNIFRILCLGDSTTFGFNVKPEDTCYALLEKKLNEQFSQGGTRYEVINAGITGYTSCQGLGLYKTRGYQYSPDIVTFYFGLNELNQKFCLSDRQIMQRDVPMMVKAALEDNVLLKLHLYRLLRKYIAGMFGTGKNSACEKVPRVSMVDFTKNVLELNELCRKSGTQLILISPPYKKEDFRKNFRNVDQYPYRQLLEYISEYYKIPLVSIPEMTEESPRDTAQFFIDTVHPNPLGHRKIMERLYDYLVSHKLLPR